MLALPPEEQYLVASGRTYFRDLAFDDLRRLQFDLETTGLDPARDRIFLVAVRDPDGATEMLEARGDGDAAEAELIRALVARSAPPIPTSSRTTTCTASICRSSRGARERLGVPLHARPHRRPGCASAQRRAARAWRRAAGAERIARARYTRPGAS